LYPSNSLSTNELALVNEFNEIIEGFQANRSSVVEPFNECLCVLDVLNIVISYLGYTPGERLLDDKRSEEVEQSFCSIT
jgi:hypothetical protein